MTKPRPEIQLNEIARLEHRQRLFYFLVDLGIRSAKSPSRMTFDIYMAVVGSIINDL